MASALRKAACATALVAALALPGTSGCATNSHAVRRFSCGTENPALAYMPEARDMSKRLCALEKRAFDARARIRQLERDYGIRAEAIRR